MKLLKPKLTMAAMIAGLSSIGGMCIAVITGLYPLESMHGLERLRPWITGIVIGCGIGAAACIILCAIGRSIEPYVDHGGS